MQKLSSGRDYDAAVPDLRLVPPSQPDPVQELLERVKKTAKRKPGTIQCARCGGRSIMTVVNSSWIDEQGKYHRGTVCEDRVCYDCHRKGIWSPMMPSPPRLVKEPKPRRTKLKSAK